MKIWLLRPLASAAWISAALPMLLMSAPARAQQISLQTIVTPSTVILKDKQPVPFAIHGFIEFKSLSELFPYIEAQTRRWKDRGIPAAETNRVAAELLRRGVESRVVSMVDERPLETLLTHTREELQQALTQVKEPVPPGYADAFLAIQEKWKHSLNCWSASPSIAGRVLSNWYPIEEGIELYGAKYDSAEHFWQAVKYHPDTTVGSLEELLALFQERNWNSWLARLDNDPQFYLPNAYAVEFLRNNLQARKLHWFQGELTEHGLRPGDRARSVQQRGEVPFRFTAFQEKVLWGDLADVFHLVYALSPAGDPIRAQLSDRHFDAVYVDQRRMGFISEEFRSLMLEVWKIKYLHMPRFGEVIRSIPIEIRLEHFLNDGDSPDIPIPVYVEYLNEIRKVVRSQ